MPAHYVYIYIYINIIYVYTQQVKVDRSTWGSVFLGVAPRHASAWNGYGFLNYRACQAYGSEIIYGAYYAAGED